MVVFEKTIKLLKNDSDRYYWLEVIKIHPKQYRESQRFNHDSDAWDAYEKNKLEWTEWEQRNY